MTSMLILCIVKFSLFSSVQLLTHVNSLWPHALQHARLPYPSPTPGACSYSCPLSQWRHPTISSSVIPFSSCLQSSPASGSFPMSQFFTSGDQMSGASASAWHSAYKFNKQGDNIQLWCTPLSKEKEFPFPVLWPLLSFLKLQAYWVQDFSSSII